MGSQGYGVLHCAAECREQPGRKEFSDEPQRLLLGCCLGLRHASTSGSCRCQHRVQRPGRSSPTHHSVHDPPLTPHLGDKEQTECVIHSVHEAQRIDEPLEHPET
ncbi:unnamed protein product [Arctogadus glacialis]